MLGGSGPSAEYNRIVSEYRLIVLRHAKSSWKSDAPTDHARPLNKRGKRDAPRVGRELQRLDWLPERVFSSDSQRTTETLEGMARGADLPEPMFLASLYGGGIAEIQELADRIEDSCRTVMVVGHNPGWDDAVEWLTGVPVNLKTANAALLSCSATSWQRALHSQHGWRLHSVIRSREL